MDYQTDVRFVNSHTECICRGNYPQFTGGKAMLYVLLCFWRKSGMKKVRCYILVL